MDWLDVAVVAVVLTLVVLVDLAWHLTAHLHRHAPHGPGDESTPAVDSKHSPARAR